MIVVEHVTKMFERFINKREKEKFYADDDISYSKVNVYVESSCWNGS